MGVHANMCVLGRPFSIRQLVYQGQNVVLMRDMTDTMYNSRMSPQVTHVHGTQLVVEHIEKYWCPTVTSTDLTGKPAFQFAEASQPHVVFLISEPEYATEVTLPVFAREQLEPRGLRCTILTGEGPDFDTFPGIAALKTADLLLISVRRRALPNEQLQLVRDYLAAGKPLVGIRTACHAFHTRGKRESGHAEWQEFDPAVLGGNYTGHYGEGPQTKLSIAGGAGEHLILRGVKVEALLGNGSLYKVNPLAGTTQALLMGEIRDQPSEPIAWTNTYQGGRVFYTTLGHKEDFRNDEFNRLLVNGVFWALNRPVPEK
jgi:type 1 glutamine amidotransferase